MVAVLRKCARCPTQILGMVPPELQLPEPLSVGRAPLRGQAVVFDPACDQLRSRATLCGVSPVRGNGEAASLPMLRTDHNPSHPLMQRPPDQQFRLPVRVHPAQGGSVAELIARVGGEPTTYPRRGVRSCAESEATARWHQHQSPRKGCSTKARLPLPNNQFSGYLESLVS